MYKDALPLNNRAMEIYVKITEDPAELVVPLLTRANLLRDQLDNQVRRG